VFHRPRGKDVRRGASFSRDMRIGLRPDFACAADANAKSSESTVAASAFI
jgi:hypothetical protein